MRTCIREQLGGQAEGWEGCPRGLAPWLSSAFPARWNSPSLGSLRALWVGKSLTQTLFPHVGGSVLHYDAGQQHKLSGEPGGEMGGVGRACWDSHATGAKPCVRRGTAALGRWHRGLLSDVCPRLWRHPSLPMLSFSSAHL